jgi:hypothetical protein
VKFFVTCRFISTIDYDEGRWFRKEVVRQLNGGGEIGIDFSREKFVNF